MENIIDSIKKLASKLWKLWLKVPRKWLMWGGVLLATFAFLASFL